MRKEGKRGLYAGLTPSLLGGALAWGLYWWAWKTIHDLHCGHLGSTELSWNMKLLCGVEAGALVTAITNPIWMVKTRMQLQTAGAAQAGGQAAAPQSFRQCVTSIAKHEGLRGFYKGLGPAMLLVSHGAIQMMVYEELKARRRAFLEPHAMPGWADSLLLGAGSKLISSCCTYPLQVVRSRMQQKLHGAQVTAYANLVSAVRSTVQRDGLRGMYRGFTANMLRVCPQAGLQFFLYEHFRRILDF